MTEIFRLLPYTAMNPSRYILLIFLCILHGKIFSQNTPGNEPVISSLLEDIISGSEDETAPPSLQEELIHFLEHPLNINTSTPEELRILKILNEFQIHSLLEYRHFNGDILSLNEIMLIPGFDRELTEQLRPFVTFSPTGNYSNPLASKKQGLRQTILLRFKQEINYRKGFRPDTSGNIAFEGNRLYMLTRYEANTGRFRIGYTAEKDPGECMIKNEYISFPDFNSAFLEYKGTGHLRKLILGDYTTCWGLGLIAGGSGAMKGTPVLASPSAGGIRKYSSSGETGFLRGSALSLRNKNLSLDLILSKCRQDASLKLLPDQTDSMLVFTSVNTSGLHRTPAEKAKKEVLTQFTAGIHGSVSLKRAEWGFTCLQSIYDQTWNRKITQWTSEIHSGGKPMGNFGIDYRASLGKMAVFAELASDFELRMALTAGILAELHPMVRLSLLYRKYHPSYLGIYAAGFGETSAARNEEGYYMGIQFYPWKYLKAECYADHYVFPTMKYNAPGPGSGSDYRINLAFSINKDFKALLRLKYSRDQNRSMPPQNGIDRMDILKKTGCRFEIHYKPFECIALVSRAELNSSCNHYKSSGPGYYSGQDLRFDFIQQGFGIWLRYAVFDIPDFENRIYVYENDVPLSFSIPALTSRGSRILVMLQKDIWDYVEISFRYSLSLFEQTQTRGTGNESVTGTTDPEITFQLRCKL